MGTTAIDRQKQRAREGNGARQSGTGAIITARGLNKTYDTSSGSSVVALQDVDLAVRHNEFVTLVGPSGCGKSTLLKMIAALIKPSSGDLLLRDRPLDVPSQDVGIVFQDAVLLPWRDVLANVMLPVEILGLPVATYRRKALDLLDLVGLSGFEDRMPDELSGGMQQRAALCRALIHDPDILLMDEPFAALDAMTREELGLELLRIWNGNRKTIVFVTHSIPEAILLADRVVVMTPRPGRIARVIDIDLERPRTLDMEFLPQFKIYSDEVRELIYSGRERKP